MAMRIPRGWPWFSPGGVGVSSEGLDSFAGGGLGEADAVAVGDDDVGVVEESVNERGGDGAGHEFLEPGWVQVRADRDGAFLVGGVDEPVEAFGRVDRKRQQPDVINDDQICAQDRGDGPVDGVVDSVCSDEGAELLDAEPCDGPVVSIAAWPRLRGTSISRCRTVRRSRGSRAARSTQRP